jgi:hypothetical protein
MKRKSPWVLILVLLLGVLAACDHIQHPTVAYSPGDLSWGSNEFHLSGSRPLGEDSIPVYYHIPETGNPATFPVVIALHGMGRNAEGMRNAWREEADARGFMVFAPHFTEELFPAGEYAEGRIQDGDGGLNAPEDWSYQVVEDLFQVILRRTDSTVQGYSLYGHSAGAQFVHRFALLMEEHRAFVVLAANAGWYLFADSTVDFPYGLAAAEAPGGRLLNDQELARAFGSELVVLVGEDDNDPEDPLLNRSQEAMDQGEHRVERGFNFVQEGSRIALEMGVPFNWTLVTVPGVGHSNSEMVPSAAPYIAR